MDNQYTVKILSRKINSISINPDIVIEENSPIELQMQTRICEPKNPKDPTVLLKTNATLVDSSNQPYVECNGEFIYHFDPIPENWRVAVIDNCSVSLRTELTELISKSLQAMGHAASFSEH